MICEDEIMNKKQRLLKVIKASGALILLGVADIIIYLKLHIGIPCLFTLVTKLRCPGCGMTRALCALVTGDINKAIGYNALSVSVLPVLIIYLIYRMIRYVIYDDEKFKVWEYFFLIIIFIVTIGYGISRNIL